MLRYNFARDSQAFLHRLSALILTNKLHQIVHIILLPYDFCMAGRWLPRSDLARIQPHRHLLLIFLIPCILFSRLYQPVLICTVCGRRFTRNRVLYHTTRIEYEPLVLTHQLSTPGLFHNF
jgi:hypothetical protein